ncbi:MAG: fructose 1,6-bisphosphatase [Alphaproteobacteria bacterium]|nr:fructose 1,6-bisphosphatase [Alphaproteobacteria bacterium]
MTGIFKQLDHAVQNLIREATRQIILPAYYEQIADELIFQKTDHSIVTKIDHDAQNFLQGKLHDLLPESGFLGEEETHWTTPFDRTGEWVWILDPIDGTHNFAYQNDDFGTMLALWHLPSHRPVYGWVYLSVSDVMFSGGGEEGVFRNGEALTPAVKNTPLEEMSGLLNYNSFGPARTPMQHNAQAFHAIAPSSCAAIKFAALLEGTADFAAFGRAKIWDLGAGFALIKALGGHAADIDSREKLSLENPAQHKAWYLATRHAANWQAICNQLFKNV